MDNLRAVVWRPSTQEWVAIDSTDEVLGTLAGGLPDGAVITWLGKLLGFETSGVIKENP